ncbi:SDR family NAD(P)-dependent oxidoreductase [Escherichia albertii]
MCYESGGSMQKVALITGGSKGIGYEAAKALRQMDYIVIIVARHAEQLRSFIPRALCRNQRGYHRSLRG